MGSRNQVRVLHLSYVIGVERQIPNELARLFLKIQFVFECEETVVGLSSLMEMILDGAAILRMDLTFDLLVL